MKTKDRKIYRVNPALERPIFVHITFGRPAKELADYLTKYSVSFWGKEKIVDEVYARKLMQRVRNLLGMPKLPKA